MKGFGGYSRVVLVVLDSAGIGALPDADKYGYTGAATLQHIAEVVQGLHLPNLEKLGLSRIEEIQGVKPVDNPIGYWALGVDWKGVLRELLRLVTNLPRKSN